MRISQFQEIQNVPTISALQRWAAVVKS